MIQLLTRSALITLLMVSFASSRFAHRLNTPADQEAAQFAQSFGISIAEICGDIDTDRSSSDCEACRLHAGLHLPQPAIALIVAELSLDPVDWAVIPPLILSQTAGATPRTRAPPAL